MPQEALPFATPSEPGDDPLADAIEQALQAAGLRAAGGVAVDPTPSELEAPAADDASGIDGD